MQSHNGGLGPGTLSYWRVESSQPYCWICLVKKLSFPAPSHVYTPSFCLRCELISPGHTARFLYFTECIPQKAPGAGCGGLWELTSRSFHCSTKWLGGCSYFAWVGCGVHWQPGCGGLTHCKGLDLGHSLSSHALSKHCTTWAWCVFCLLLVTLNYAHVSSLDGTYLPFDLGCTVWPQEMETPS